MSNTDAPKDGEQGRDLSDGLLDYRSGAEKATITTFIDEVTVIRRLRVGVASVLVIVLAGLGVALWATICSFTTQVDKATPEVKHLVEAAKAGGSPAPIVAGLSEAADSGKAAGKTPPAAAGASKPLVIAAGDTPAVTTSVKIDIASMATSIVAVISILVIAIAAISISLLRATFSLAPHRRDEPKPEGSATEIKDAKADGLPLPAVELLKSLIDCVKSVAGKAEK